MWPLEKLGLEVAAFRLLGSRTKAATLCALLHARGSSLTCDQIADAKTWSEREITDVKNVVKTRVCLLRETLEDVGFPRVLQTDRANGGYLISSADRERIIAYLIEMAT